MSIFALIEGLPYMGIGVVIGGLAAVGYFSFTGSVLKWKK